MLVGEGALGQGEPEPKRSDVLKGEKSIRPREMEGGGNAAVEYFRVWDSLSKADFDAISHFGSVDFLQNDPIRLAPLQRDLCLKHQDYIEGLVRVTGMPVCDWGVQHEYGSDFLLPHLGFLRSSYRALKLDYLRCVEDGSGVAASARLIAMVRMSNQTRTDATFISALVGEAINAGASESVKDFLKTPLVTPAIAKQLLDAYRPIALDNPFGFVSAMDGERWQATQWPREECRGEQAGARYFIKLGGLDGLAYWWPTSFAVSMNEQRLYADLDRFDRYLTMTLPLWGKPENEVRLREFAAEAMEGQYGLTASISAETFELIRRNLNRSRRELQGVIREIEAYLKRQGKGGE